MTGADPRAEVVGVFAAPHTPLLWRVLQSGPGDDLLAVERNLVALREQLAAVNADTIVMVSSDHLRQFVSGTIPAFLVGRGPTMRGTFPDEVRAFGIPYREVEGDPDLARWLLGARELPDAFDFAHSDELWLDHGFMVPLLYLLPDLDVPVVPIHTNTMSLPVPGAGRFSALGTFLRAAIESAPFPKRVAVLVSGHLATEIGGPRQFSGSSPDADFDREAVAALSSGNLADAVELGSFDRLVSAGNMTHQYLNLVAGLAAAAGAAPSLAEGTVCRFGTLPFFSWTGGS